MDETRDIAVEARASADSAHHRLNTINGQIRRLGDEQHQTRLDFGEKLGELKTEIAVGKMKHAVASAVACALLTAAVSVGLNHWLDHAASAKAPAAAQVRSLP